MKLLIHGSDIVESRNFLNSELERHRKKGLEIYRLDGSSVSPNELTQILESKTLFLQSQVVVIDSLLGRRESGEKKKLLSLVEADSTSELILWEEKAIKVAELVKLHSFKPTEFKLSSQIFQFLDSLGTSPGTSLQLFHLVLRAEPAEKLLSSLCSRLHLLLMAKVDPDSLKIQGFYRSKIITQASRIKVEDIQKKIREFLDIEYGLKSGQSTTPLETTLELHFSRNLI